MKKIFSILALLLLLVAFYPQKVEAKPYPMKIGHFASDGFCDPGGVGCTYLEDIIYI